MMRQVRRLRDRDKIEAFLRRDPALHVYSLGDLDDFFWPHTTWYAWEEAGEMADLALLYKGQTLPTLVGISERPATMRKLISEIDFLLPALFYAHLSPGVEATFYGHHALESHGVHHKMALRDTTRARQVDCSQTVPLTQHDAADLGRLYARSYPGNWFDTRMLGTGQYFGLKKDGRLVSAAGVHVYSERYRVAALGNIVTDPDHRRKGYGRQVIARLCQSVLETVEHVGLNVKADNHAAIQCYRSLGFEIVAPYGEFTIAMCR